MDVLEAIRQRRSHRAFDARLVEAEKIDRIIEAACWAPSPANSQPWEFVVVSTPESRKRLYELSEKARTSGAIELHGFSFVRPMPFESLEEEEKAQADALMSYSFAFLKRVPVIIAVVGIPITRVKSAMGRVTDGYKYACAAAIQNMCLAAHAEGLGSLWFTLFDQELVKEFLNIEMEKHLIALVCIGYPATQPPSPGRYPVESKVRRFD